MKLGTEDLKVELVPVLGAGYGLVARENIQANTALFSIPVSAQLNTRTLSPYFPQDSLPTSRQYESKLTATQAISLYIAAQRFSLDCPWAPYLRILPRSFDDHPLTIWLNADIASSSHETSYHAALVLAPPNVLDLLHVASERCLKDFEVITGFLRRHPTSFELDGQLSKANFIWGWLVVNTRQVWTPLDLAKNDNVTLCPMFDMCNHSYTAGGRLTKDRNSLTLRLPHDVKAGEEILIRYGSHANAALFVEYGFILGDSCKEVWQVPVYDLIAQLFRRQDKEGDEKLALLEDNGYTRKEFLLCYHPEPAQPSYHVIVALRLLHSPVHTSPHEAWIRSIRGEVDFSALHPAIDKRVIESLATLCGHIKLRAEAGLQSLTSLVSETADSVRALWQEEIIVAEAVENSIRDKVIDLG